MCLKQAKYFRAGTRCSKMEIYAKMIKKYFKELNMAFFGFKDLSSLSSVDMTIYRYVTTNLDKVVYMRVRDIAKNAHVSNSSVMRFIHKIGFNSFPDFKAFIKNSNTIENSPNQIIHFFNKSNFPSDIESKIRVVADKLYQSDNIICFGMGSSAYIAGYTERKLASMGFNASSVTDPFYPLPTRLKYTTNNVLIIFSVSGETTEAVEAINPFINDDDLTLISITGNATSTIARMSHYSLTYNQKTDRIDKYYDLSSQIPAMYIIEAIMKLLENKK